MMKTLEWLKNNTIPGGGVRAWAGHIEYPEVTGYLIPTLIELREYTLARQYADRLISIQNPDGSFNGLDGVPRSFDTGAVVEGLQAAYRTFQNKSYTLAYGRAIAWLKTMLMPGNTFRISPTDSGTHIYNLRVNGILGMYSKPPRAFLPVRAHYFAYALEGLLPFERKRVTQYLEKTVQLCEVNGLLPFDILRGWKGGGTDACATAQVAVLMYKCGLNPSRLMAGLERMVKPDGGIRLKQGDGFAPAWAAKFYLDAKICEGQVMYSEAVRV